MEWHEIGGVKSKGAKGGDAICNISRASRRLLTRRAKNRRHCAIPSLGTVERKKVCKHMQNANIKVTEPILYNLVICFPCYLSSGR